MSDAVDMLLLIHGDEPFLVDRDARAWLKAARAAAVTDLDVEVLDAPARLDGLRRSLSAVPFLADRRSVLVRDPPQLAERARRGAESAEALAAALGERAPTTALCIVVHQKVAPTSPVLAAVRTGGRVVEHQRLRGRDLRATADRLAAERAVRLPRGGIEHILLVSGGDLGIVDTELAKLAAFAAGGAVSLEDVRALTAGAEHVEIWDLLDRLLTPPHARGAAALENLIAGGTSSQYVITTLAAQLRELLQAVDVLGSGRGAGALASELGIPPWRADRLARWARVVTAEKVEGWMRALQRLDADVKMGLADVSAGLRSVVLRAARDLSTTPAAR